MIVNELLILQGQKTKIVKITVATIFKQEWQDEKRHDIKKPNVG